MEQDKEDKKHTPLDGEDVAILKTCHHHLQVRKKQKQLKARQQAAKLRQAMNVRRGMFQKHSLQGQGSTYPPQHLKPGAVYSPQLLEGESGKPRANELPIERLVRAVKSCSPQALSSAVSDIRSVVSMVDRIASSATGKGSRASAVPLSVGDKYKQFAGSETADLESTATTNGKKARIEIISSAPGNGWRASVGEDLVPMTNCRLQGRNFMAQEGTPTKKMKIKRALLEEIKEINQRLIDTIVEISDDEDADADHSEGTTVRFSFVAVSLSPALKAHLTSTQMSPIQPIHLLVPSSYPNGSPSLLDKLPVKNSKEKEDLSSKAMARLNILLGSLSQPLSLKDIAKTWDASVRAVICEYAQQFGGGTFSSKYGSWEKYVAAS